MAGARRGADGSAVSRRHTGALRLSARAKYTQAVSGVVISWQCSNAKVPRAGGVCFRLWRRGDLIRSIYLPAATEPQE